MHGYDVREYAVPLFLKMRNNTKKLTLCAVFAALATVFLYVASVFPTGQLGFLAIASLFGVSSVVESGVSGGLFVYICTSILGFLLVPNKTHVLMYVLFFGYYPVLKMLTERLKNRFFEWAIKIAVFNAALTVIIFVFSISVFNIELLNDSYLLLYFALNAVFIVFDFGVSRVIMFYAEKISPRIRGK